MEKTRRAAEANLFPGVSKKWLHQRAAFDQTPPTESNKFPINIIHGNMNFSLLLLLCSSLFAHSLKKKHSGNGFNQEPDLFFERWMWLELD
jgi:hypothetical protein